MTLLRTSFRAWSGIQFIKLDSRFYGNDNPHYHGKEVLDSLHLSIKEYWNVGILGW
jgi:hypothetical protein